MRKINKRSKRRHRIRWAIILMIALLLGLGLGCYISIVSDLPPAESISFFIPPVATKVYDDNNTLINEFFIERRELTNLENVPQYLKGGFICVEDKLFYKHWGVDILALIRSLITNILHMKIVQGGSTITMQLARNMFLSMEQTMVRKLKEIALAIRIERTYTKNEILEKYFNQINFGQGRYGVATAAKYYFNKDISELTLSECALLIALPRSPEKYSPYKHPEIAKHRRNFILKKMFANNLMDSIEYEEAINESLIVVEQKGENRIGEYYLEEIRKYLELKYGPEFLYRSGANIYTALNTSIQKAAEEILEKHLVNIEKEYKFKNAKSKYDSLGLSDTVTLSPYLQDALVVMDYHTGEVKALIGGRDFSLSKFNRATQARRQAGSAFKIFVFTAALDNGFTPNDIVLDLPIVIEVPGMDSIYRPSNYDRKFLGPITLRKALKHSRNLVAIRLIRNIGPELVVQYAHNLGVQSPLLAVVSLALGACEVKLIEMVSAVGTIANLGEKVQPVFIKKITDKDGTIIEINHPIPEKKLSAQISYIMINMMSAVVNGGTAYRIRKYYKGPAAGKTGTTNNYSDATFIGFTPNYVAGVWIGYDNNDRIFRGATGGHIAAPIWGELMAKIDSLPGSNFVKPTGLVERKICPETGLLATPFCPHATDEVFLSGTEPTDTCDLHSFEGGIDYQDDFEKIDESIIEKY
ncbi:PBP1A family penicillin-binding protein [candidate division WOR-3 bacterium]|nr:PBP1A family penicillin-binding protein [candidate division WOR-3 bacterium]